MMHDDVIHVAAEAVLYESPLLKMRRACEQAALALDLLGNPDADNDVTVAALNKAAVMLQEALSPSR